MIPQSDLDYSAFVNIVLKLTLWTLYSLLFVYAMTKWAILRQRQEILVGIIVVYILSSGTALLSIAPLMRTVKVSGGIKGLNLSFAPGEGFASGILTVYANTLGELTLVYLLWIVIGEPKLTGWIAVPITTLILGTGFGLVNVITEVTEPNSDLNNVSLLLNAFLVLSTNFIATVALFYYMWKEMGHGGTSSPNKALLRRVAFVLIVTGFIYFAVQLSYTIVSAVVLIQVMHGARTLSLNTVYAWNVISALSAMAPGISTTIIAARSQEALEAEQCCMNS